jgi:hypothetical protein
MTRSLTVTPSSNSTAEPNADVTLTLSDYTFTLSKPLAAGKRMTRWRTPPAAARGPAGALAPGKTIRTSGSGRRHEGSAAGKPIGGIPAFVPGKAFFEADLTPGDYGMICFVPDAKDGSRTSSTG